MLFLDFYRRATSMDLPMAMRFRKLKEHAREAVGVYRCLFVLYKMHITAKQGKGVPCTLINCDKFKVLFLGFIDIYKTLNVYSLLIFGTLIN